jgi:hypothetical protein
MQQAKGLPFHSTTIQQLLAEEESLQIESAPG